MPLVILLLLLGCTLQPAAATAQPARAPVCTESQQCRQLALQAAERGDYETFHDLAWRAVQTGKRNDAALMYLLARAQALSGRSHDALVMLQRLADMGVGSDAATNDDFRHTRELPGWPELAARLERLNQSELGRASAGGAGGRPGSAAARAEPTAPTPPPAAAPHTPATPRTPPAGVAPPNAARDPAGAAPSPVPPKPVPPEPAGRFSTAPFQLAGFAYDVVSARFLFGDRTGRKLIVVGEGSNYAVDLVRAESAGFRQVGAIAIDEKRGDLWVASSSDGAGILHRLQLVSGRPLKSFPIPSDYEPVNLVDLAVTPGGSVLALNAATPGVLVLPAGEAAVARAIAADAGEPLSVAAAGDERTAYIADRDGVSRVDLIRATAARVAAPNGMSLAGLERIRWFHNALIAVAPGGDGSRHLLRLDLNSTGTDVIQATTLETNLPASGPASVTISGSELIYVVADQRDGHGQNAEFATYRVHLR